jgi:hypothetical protein
MDRGQHPKSMVRWRVFDHRVAHVARALGSHLAGCGVAGIRLPATALSVKTPTHARTPRGPRHFALGASVRDSPAHPPFRPHFTETSGSSPHSASADRPRPYRKEIAYFSTPHTFTFRRICVVPSSKTILKSNRQPAASSILVHTELAGADPEDRCPKAGRRRGRCKFLQ